METLESKNSNICSSSQEQNLGGKFSKALGLYDLHLQIYSFVGIEDTLKYAQILDKISYMHFELCEYQQALEKCNESFRIKSLRNQDDNDEIHLIENYKLFGMISRAQANDDALIMYKECEEISLKFFSPDDPQLSEIYYELGLIDFEHGKYDDALNYFNSSVDCVLSRDSLCPSDHRKVGKYFEGVAKVLQHKKLTGNSCSYENKAAESYRNGINRAHQELSLGHIFADELSCDLKIEEFERVLTNQLESFKKEIELAECHRSLARIAFKKGRLEDAYVSEKKAFEIFKELFDESHPRFAVISQNLGDYFLQKSNQEQALRYFSRAKSIFSKAFGEDYHELPTILEKMGKIYQIQKQYSQALGCFLQSLPVRNFNFERTYINFQGLLSFLNNFDEVLKYYQTYLKRRTANIEDDLIFGQVCFNIARILSFRKSFEKSLDYYKKCLNIRLTKCQDDHLSIANVYSHMAFVAKKSCGLSFGSQILSSKYETLLETLGSKPF